MEDVYWISKDLHQPRYLFKFHIHFPESMGFTNLVIFSSSLVLLCSKLVMANWDPATGHLHDYRPSQSWMNEHKGEVL
jgi:hypothetical protein